MTRSLAAIAACGCLVGGCSEPTAPAVPIKFSNDRMSAPPPSDQPSKPTTPENPFPPGTPYGDDPNAGTEKSRLLMPQDGPIENREPRRLYPGAPDPTPGTGYANPPSGTAPSTSPYGTPMPGASGPVTTGGGSEPGSSPYGGNPYGG